MSRPQANTVHHAPGRKRKPETGRSIRLWKELIYLERLKSGKKGVDFYPLLATQTGCLLPNRSTWNDLSVRKSGHKFDPVI